MALEIIAANIWSPAPILFHPTAQILSLRTMSFARSAQVILSVLKLSIARSRQVALSNLHVKKAATETAIIVWKGSSKS